MKCRSREAPVHVFCCWVESRSANRSSCGGISSRERTKRLLALVKIGCSASASAKSADITVRVCPRPSSDQLPLHGISNRLHIVFGRAFRFSRELLRQRVLVRRLYRHSAVGIL